MNAAEIAVAISGLVLSFLAPIIGIDWIKSCGGDPWAFAVWSLTTFALGLMFSMLSYGTRWRTKAESAERTLVETKKELRLAERNADLSLGERGEDLNHVKRCRRILEHLTAMNGDVRQMDEYVKENLTGYIGNNMDFGRAFNDLRQYGCIATPYPLELTPSGKYEVYGDHVAIQVTRNEYPPLTERIKMDAVNESEISRWRAEQRAERDEVFRRRGIAVL